MQFSLASQTGLAVFCAALLSGCGDSGTQVQAALDTAANPTSSDAGSNDVTTDTPTAPATPPEPTNTPVTSDPIETPTEPVTEPPAAEPPAVVPPAVVAPPTNSTPPQTTAPGDVPAIITAAVANGQTASGGDDDSPTQTESLSLIGPFLKDTSRAAGPPSVPTGLVALMKSYDWVEFSWVPSVDDQSVEGYEILRDGVPVFNLRGDTGYEFDYKSWITTSYIDCNYTRYTGCTGNQPADGASHQYSVVAIDNEGMRSAASDPVTITLPKSTGNGVDLSGYELVLNEEFTGSELDRSIWKTSLAWGPDRVVNGEKQYFVNIFGNDDVNYDPFVLTGSTLQITGVKTPASELSKANNQPYLSGVINTQDNFSFTYGYVEMNAKLASGSGLLSTFYLFNQSFEDNQPEIDILEYIGDRPSKTYQTYHYYDSNRSRWATGERHSSPTMEFDAGFDLSSGFHKYGVLWAPELAIWTIDGVEVRRLEGPRVSDEPMNIIAHLVLGSEWIGNPDEGALPAVLEIDYIKAWQKP